MRNEALSDVAVLGRRPSRRRARSGTRPRSLARPH